MRMFAALCFALALTALPAFAAPAQSDKPKWEYAELQIRTTRTPPAEGEEGPRTTTTIHWSTGSEEVEVKTLPELAEKLKGPAIKKDASATLQRLQLMNHLGSEGWELMSQTGGGPIPAGVTFGPGGAAGGPGGRGTFGGTGATTMLFKRRVQ
jgi:hypothetical protein